MTTTTQEPKVAAEIHGADIRFRLEGLKRKAAEAIKKSHDFHLQMENEHFIGEYTQLQLRAAFESVQAPHDWKAPIVNASCELGDAGLVAMAIEFYTGTKARFDYIRETNRLRVQAIGYRAGPCGDH